MSLADRQAQQAKGRKWGGIFHTPPVPLLWQDATEEGVVSQEEGSCMKLGREETGSGMRRRHAPYSFLERNSYWVLRLSTPVSLSVA